MSLAVRTPLSIRKSRLFVTVLAFAGNFVSTSGSAAIETFIKVDGIPGDATSVNHPNEIPILALTEGYTVGGPARTKFDCNGLTFMKAVDRTTPKLIQALGSGQVIPNVRLSYSRPSGANQVDYFTIQLTNATITSLQLAGANDHPTESVSVAAKAMLITFIPEDSSPISTSVLCP